MYVQELRNANASFLQKLLCTRGGKTKPEKFKTQLAYPHLWNEKIFF